MKMKYFWVTVDKNFVPPVPIGWFGKIDKKILGENKFYEMPKHMLFEVEKHIQMAFTDIITFPCFMVSRTVKDMFLRYAPDIKFVRIILYDRERQHSKPYYLPFIKSAGWVRKGSNGVLSVEKGLLNNKAIIRMDGIDKTYIMLRMDLAESILRRQTIGIGLNEVIIL